MKSLFLLTCMAVAVLAESPKTVEFSNQGLDMQLETEKVFNEMVKVYDYQGNLIKEFNLADVVNNEITLSDHFILEQSDYAFDYLGDYYYFSRKKINPMIN
ncbi:MAG: hypothetical protein Tsb0034_18360 [Ekhidna sp.]